MPSGTKIAKPSFNIPVHLMRGLAIFLVVLGHSLGPMEKADHTGIAIAAIGLIFSFHMQLFFAISGFVGGRLFLCEPRDAGRVAVRQLKRMMVPYFFYTALAVIFKLAVSSFVNRPVDFRQLPSAVLVYPHDNPLVDLWFIYSLFVIQMLFLILHAVLGLDCRKRIHVGLLLIILVAAQAVVSWQRSSDLPLALNFVAKYAIYVFLGFLAGQHWERLESWLRRYAMAWLVFGLVYLVCALSYGRYLYPRGAEAHWLILWPTTFFYALTGIILATVSAIRLTDKRSFLMRPFAWLADYSYEIYLNGGFFQQAGMIVIVGILKLDARLLLPALLVLGILGPFLLTWCLYKRFIVFRRLAMGDWK